ncbi:MAG: phage holin family protein [Bacteroidetes bacterium]|nr:phage holin family protein [Bacteroidota bacterium]
MASLKDNINNISDDTESLVKDYLKLFSIKQSEKFALFLGVLSTAFILTLLILIVLVFCSFALAGYLNDLLATDYWGYWIVTALFLLLITFLIFKIIKTRTPLLSNLFAKIIISVFDLDINQAKNIKGLRFEGEAAKNKIETDKTKIKANVQMLRYVIMESLFREFFGLFSSKQKDTGPDEAESGQASDEKDKDE